MGMAKKRGGLAGLYDRNKGLIKTVAPIAAGFIPGIGPMLGAGIGAAMGGLDREGKSGIGLDVGGAVKGGLSGYGGAKLGQAAKGGLANMFTGGMKSAGGAGGAASSAPMSAPMPIPTPPPSSNPLSGLGSALKSKEGLAFAGNAMQAGAGIMGAQAQGARQDRDYEEQQRQLRARAELMAMFAPQMAGNLGMKLPYGGA
jgi:hypothetical protein